MVFHHALVREAVSGWLQGVRGWKWGKYLSNIESLRALGLSHRQFLHLRAAQQKPGQYLIVDPVKESRHRGKHCGLQSLHVIRQQPNVSLEEPNSGSTRVYNHLKAKPNTRAQSLRPPSGGACLGQNQGTRLMSMGPFLYIAPTLLPMFQVPRTLKARPQDKWESISSEVTGQVRQTVRLRTHATPPTALGDMRCLRCHALQFFYFDISCING